VVDGDVALTWDELLEDVRRAAEGLRRRGVRHGDRVGLWSPNSSRWVRAALAVLDVGAVLVPMSSRLKGFEVLDALAGAGAGILIMQGQFLDRDNIGLLTDAARVTSRPLPALIVLDEEHASLPVDAVAWRDVVDLAAAGALADSALPGTTDASDMLFTSGTTGRSRGLAMTHGQVASHARAWAERVGLTCDDRYLILSPMSHTFGYKTGLLACLAVGATMVPAALADPDQVAALLVRHRITVLPGVPAALRALVAEPTLPSAEKLAVRVVVTGAAPCEADEIRRFRARLGAGSIISAYGLTEAGAVTMCDPSTPDDKVATTAGRPLEGVEIAIHGSDGNPVEAGGKGQVMVRSPFVSARPDGLGDGVDMQGDWLATGDVGVLDPDGYLTIVDRLKDVLQTGGFSVYSAEVENVITALDGVEAAAIVGVPDERLGEVGVAFVVASGPGIDAGRILEHCTRRLAGFKVPRRVVLLPALPTNATGKVLKNELRELA